jgi:hypothetical protein
VGGVYSSMETMLLDKKTAHHGGDVCVMCVLLAKSLPSVSFSVPAGTHLAVKLLTHGCWGDRWDKIQFPREAGAGETNREERRTYRLGSTDPGTEVILSSS